MEKSIEVSGKDIDEAKKLALEQLQASEDRVSFEVIEEPSKGIFGLIGAKGARVKATVREFSVAEKAQRFLDDFFAAAKTKVKISKQEIENGYMFSVRGEDMGLMIGKHGQTLEALQYLTNLAANRGLSEGRLYIVVDIENYRARREETLCRLAHSIAERVKVTRRKVVLEPMSRHDRKIIHMALQNESAVGTYSSGEEPRRHVIVDLAINVPAVQ